jgi:hypothetical protein
VLLSYDLWQTQFGAGVVGKRVELDGTIHSRRRHAARLRFRRATKRWTPLERALRLSGASNEDRTDNMLDVVARQRRRHARSGRRAAVIAARLSASSQRNEKTGATVRRCPLWAIEIGCCSTRSVVPRSHPASCLRNLANLLLVRALGRERRSPSAPLGAGRGPPARQLMTESVLLVALGVRRDRRGTLAIPALTRLVPIFGLPSLDLRMLTAAGLLIALVGIGFGVIPALRGTGLDALREGARSGGGRKQWTARARDGRGDGVRRVTISSGLLMRAMWRFQSRIRGSRQGVLTLPRRCRVEAATRDAG